MIIPHDIDTESIEPHCLNHYNSMLPILVWHSWVMNFPCVDWEMFFYWGWHCWCLVVSHIWVASQGEDKNRDESDTGEVCISLGEYWFRTDHLFFVIEFIILLPLWYVTHSFIINSLINKFTDIIYRSSLIQLTTPAKRNRLVRIQYK